MLKLLFCFSSVNLYLSKQVSIPAYNLLQAFRVGSSALSSYVVNPSASRSSFGEPVHLSCVSVQHNVPGRQNAQLEQMWKKYSGSHVLVGSRSVVGHSYGSLINNSYRTVSYQRQKDFDLLNMSAHKFTIPQKAFTPRTLRTEKKSKLVEMPCYNKPRLRNSRSGTPVAGIEKVVDVPPLDIDRESDHLKWLQVQYLSPCFNLCCLLYRVHAVWF